MMNLLFRRNDGYPHEGGFSRMITIGQLAAAERLFVSPQVADYLDRLRRLGVSERMVRRERDGRILRQSVSPRQASAWIAEKLDAIDDPEFRALYREYDAAFTWPPHDPRLDRLAERGRRRLESRRAESAGERPCAEEPTAAGLVAASCGASSPAWERLAAISGQGRKND
jgi:FMN phosphatase YigB (HAD superfamily)